MPFNLFNVYRQILLDLLLGFLWVLLGFPKTCRWNDDAKLPLVVNDCLFSPHTQNSWDRLWIHCDLEDE